MKSSAPSTISRTDFAVNARAISAATYMPPYTPSPSWLTDAALAAYSAASAGCPGSTSPQVSMKICPPICSATAGPFWAMLPERGAGMPLYRFR